MGEFDSFLVRVEIGANRKLRRLTSEQRWCVVAGVWALAAKSPVRGYLLVAEGIEVEIADVAEQAGVKTAVAKATMEKLRQLGMLERDEEIGAEHVHDWHKIQKDPKPSESREAWRERKRQSRGSPAPKCPDVPRDTPTDVTTGREEKRREEKELPPKPPASGGRDRDRKRFEDEQAAWVDAHPIVESEEWEQASAAMFEKVGEGIFHVSLAALHLHVGGEVWVIGTPADRAEWIKARFGGLIAEVCGREVEFVGCGCEKGVVAA